MNGLRVNTVLTACGLVLMGLLGFLGTHIWTKTEATHDAVIAINNTMVRQSELADVKAKMNVVEQKMSDQADRIVALQHAQDEMSLEIRHIRQTTVTTKP